LRRGAINVSAVSERGKFLPIENERRGGCTRSKTARKTGPGGVDLSKLKKKKGEEVKREQALWDGFLDQ